MRSVVSVSDSETSLRVFEGKHTWTIRNWKEWINCSEDSKKSTIYSDVFSVPGLIHLVRDGDFDSP